ncbi:hypothetical protein [Corynebacterium sp.]|uniref:hypothetical protein n=1 Tax=Corynebacterium sp. TaxID=1720 RepID=UPI0026E0B360|nr:hypothetical protein [Corynebacterium sp.]MDO5513279.1 hypothetical protein [Corynebacterium sp.]
MGKRYEIKRGVDRDTMANNFKAMWHNSPGIRLRLYLVLALILGAALWWTVSSLWTIVSALIAA